MKSLILIILSLLLFSCGDKPNSSSSDIPIALYKVDDGLKKVINVTPEMNALSYDITLDTIYGKSSFMFSIANTGNSEIKNLSFDFDVDYFKISPDSIFSLEVPSNGSSITQLIKVTIEHGKSAKQNEFANVLTGNQFGTLTINGENDDGKFSVTYTMRVYAKRMIINIDVPDTVVDNNAVVWSIDKAGMQPFLRHAHVDPSSDDCNLDIDGLILDTSYNLNLKDMQDNYNYFNSTSPKFYYEFEMKDYNNLNVKAYKDSLTHLKFITELNMVKKLEDGSSIRKSHNCIILVNDNWPLENVDKDRSKWIKKQYILE